MPDDGRWWVAAHETEVGDAKPFAARIGALELALFRDSSGIVRALEDRCAHRRAPLSLGTVSSNGLLQCPYHGWRYEGGGGRCLAIPNLSAGERVPGNYGIRAFATHVSAGLVQVWSGGTEPANSADDLTLPADAAHASRLLACPQPMIAALLLDRPGSILAFDGVEVLDDFRWGDPQCAGRAVAVEFGAIWAGRRRRRLPSSPPLTLRLEVGVVTALTRVELRDEEQALLCQAIVAPVPWGDWLTRTCYAWSTDATVSAGRLPALQVRPVVDPAEVAWIRRAGHPVWLEMSEELE